MAGTFKYQSLAQFYCIDTNKEINLLLFYLGAYSDQTIKLNE